MDYSPRKRPEMLEITSFDDVARVVYRGSRRIEILPGPKNHGRPQKRLEMAEIMRFTMPLESCPGSHGASKSSRDTKTVEYSPQKRPGLVEIMSFHDATRIVYRGSRGIEILPGPENRGL